MTTEQWRAAVAAARPPLTPAQVTALRPVCQLMAAHMKSAAPARTGTAPDRTAPATQERNTA